MQSWNVNSIINGRKAKLRNNLTINSAENRYYVALTPCFRHVGNKKGVTHTHHVSKAGVTHHVKFKEIKNQQLVRGRDFKKKKV